MRTELSPGLERLILSPRRLSAVRLWNVLRPQEREAAAWALLRSEETGRFHLGQAVAEARNFRPATVMRWPEGKIVTTIRRVPLQDPGTALLLLNSHHVPGQLPMVTAFLDAMGVPHDDGEVAPSDPLDGDEEVVRAAAEGIAKDHGLRAVAIYMLTLRLWNAPAGEKGRRWVRDMLEAGTEATRPRADELAGTEATRPQPDEPVATASDPQPEPGTDDSEADPDDSAADPDDPSRLPSFTTLDRLLILAAVDTAQGIEGALGEDELDDVVEELVKLNGRRHQSYFHAGFRDVLFDRALAEELPAENQARLRWYWAGAIRGWARRKRWDRIVEEFDRTPTVRDLGRGADAASAKAVHHVVEALGRCDRPADIAPFVKAPALVQHPPLFGMLLGAATKLLRDGDAGRALPIFELLIKARPELEERDASPSQRLLLDAHRRMAHCLRQLHEHDRARKLLRQLLEEDPDPHIRAMVHADLGVMAAGFNGLGEVALPHREDELDGTLTRLAEGAPHFHDSVGVGTTYAAHGHYCLGVLALGRAVSDQAFVDAERHLQGAHVHFCEMAGSYPERLVERANLYFGIAKAQQLSSDKLAHAADVIVKAMTAGARFPVYLAGPTAEAFGLADDASDLRRVADAILDGGGDDVLDELATCEPALEHCPALCRRLLERAGTKNRPGGARAADLRWALRGFLKRNDLEAAREALDGLEDLARNRVAVPEFIELLGDPARYQPAWDLDDATVALAGCHEARGEFLDAVTVLRDLFYRLASPEGLGDAADLLRRIKSYGIEPDFYSGLTRRYMALAEEAEEAAPASEPTRRAAPVRVLVVGGAEQQAKAEAMARRKLEEDHPRIRARFVQTGWKGNWQRVMPEIEREMARHDALVIVRFMRTDLGRHIRARWSGGPWRSCWSGGPGGMVDAVVRAAEAVRASR